MASYDPRVSITRLVAENIHRMFRSEYVKVSIIMYFIFT